jgi:hypothetical protein
MSLALRSKKKNAISSLLVPTMSGLSREITGAVGSKG